MNRYYSVTYSATNSTIRRRWETIELRLQPGWIGRRERANDLLHYRESADGSIRLLQLETNAEEHAFLNGTTGVTYLGDQTPEGYAPQAVHDYLAADPARWPGV